MRFGIEILTARLQLIKVCVSKGTRPQMNRTGRKERQQTVRQMVLPER